MIDIIAPERARPLPVIREESLFEIIRDVVIRDFTRQEQLWGGPPPEGCEPTVHYKVFDGHSTVRYFRFLGAGDLW